MIMLWEISWFVPSIDEHKEHEHKRIGSKKEEKWIVVIHKIIILRKKWFLGKNENHELVKIWKENQSYFSSNSILKWT